MTEKTTQCRRCGREITEAEHRRQYRRCRRLYNLWATNYLMPLCERCLTRFLDRAGPQRVVVLPGQDTFNPDPSPQAAAAGPDN